MGEAQAFSLFLVLALGALLLSVIVLDALYGDWFDDTGCP